MSTKSSTKSSRSSLRSTVSASSISTTVRSGAKSVKHGIKSGVKRIKKSADALIRPLKRAKHALSNVSTPAVSDAEDQASSQTDESPEVIEVCSEDEGMDKLKKELGTHTCNSCLLSPSLISTLSSSPENLEVPNIFILQDRSNHSGTQRPCCPLLHLLRVEMQERGRRHSTFSRQSRQVVDC